MQEQIDELINDTIELGQRIIKIDSLILRLKEEDLRKFYEEQLLELLDDYQLMASKLEVDLTEYIKFEEDNNLPIDLEYRKILKSLKNK